MNLQCFFFLFDDLTRNASPQTELWNWLCSGWLHFMTKNHAQIVCSFKQKNKIEKSNDTCQEINKCKTIECSILIKSKRPISVLNNRFVDRQPFVFDVKIKTCRHFGSDVNFVAEQNQQKALCFGNYFRWIFFYYENGDGLSLLSKFHCI